MTQTIEANFSPTDGGALTRFQPVQTIDQALALRAQIVEFTSRIMKADHDYGVIPGTNGKPTLLKPGAEKLCQHFGLTDTFDIISQNEDWTGTEHGGEPFFSYTLKCKLARHGEVVSEGIGSCNSWEKKYRFRRVFGNKATEQDKKRGKPIPGKFGTDYLVPNDDIFDQINTLQKMAKKRALVDATLRAVSASEFYTQDLEDLPRDEPPVAAPVARETPPPPPALQVVTTQHEPPPDEPSADKAKRKAFLSAWKDNEIEMTDSVISRALSISKEDALLYFDEAGTTLYYKAFSDAQLDKLTHYCATGEPLKEADA